MQVPLEAGNRAAVYADVIEGWRSVGGKDGSYARVGCWLGKESYPTLLGWVFDVE